MPPANNIGFSASSMVTSTVGVQTSCPNSPTYSNLYSGDHDDEEDICPKHFTDIHRCKLEDTFSRKQKPDDIQLQIIAMECNLLYKDVRDWFRKRRVKWLEDLVRNENSYENNSENNSMNNQKMNNNFNNSDSNNNNMSMVAKKQNSIKHNNTMEHKINKNILSHNSRGPQDVTTT